VPNGEKKQGEGMWEWRRDQLWDEAKANFGDANQFWAEVGIDPHMDKKLLTEKQVERLASWLEIVRQENEEQATRSALPYKTASFLEEYNVPQSEREELRNYPMKVKNLPGTLIGAYHVPLERIDIKPGHATTAVIGHELAHANYFEQLPSFMRATYPVAHGLAQFLNPAYSEAAASYPATAKGGVFKFLPPV
jgi:hypothetical protein